MAWNESGNGRNPWDRGGGDRQGPPDLDRIVRDWQQKLGNLLRGGRGGADPCSGRSVGLSRTCRASMCHRLAAHRVLYRVDDAERAWCCASASTASTSMPGLRWHLPWPIERVELVNVNEISPFNKQTRMLTADENIVDVDLVVQYQKADPSSISSTCAIPRRRSPTSVKAPYARSSARARWTSRSVKAVPKSR